jgi:DNA mismatch endonuclease Vsr
MPTREHPITMPKAPRHRSGSGVKARVAEARNGPEVTLARSKNMAAVRPKDTVPELAVRRMLHRMGFRYRLHVRGLPGRPDIVFPSRRKVIEVRGCFWHRHPDPACRNAVLPTTRREWWTNKLNANVERDARNIEALSQLGWSVLVIWECEVERADCEARLIHFLNDPSEGLTALACRHG